MKDDFDILIVLIFSLFWRAMDVREASMLFWGFFCIMSCSVFKYLFSECLNCDPVRTAENGTAAESDEAGMQILLVTNTLTKCEQLLRN